MTGTETRGRRAGCGGRRGVAGQGAPQDLRTRGGPYQAFRAVDAGPDKRRGVIARAGTPIVPDDERDPGERGCFRGFNLSLISPWQFSVYFKQKRRNRFCRASLLSGSVNMFAFLGGCLRPIKRARFFRPS